MKKILSMFAFVAIIVLGAVSLASCEKDDITDTGANDKHKYTYKGEFGSDNASKEDLDKVNQFIQASIDKDPNFAPITCTQGEASIVWYNIETEGNSKLQGLVDESAKMLNDPTLSYTLQMLQDGKEYKKKTWKPSPLLFL